MALFIGGGGGGASYLQSDEKLVDAPDPCEVGG